MPWQGENARDCVLVLDGGHGEISQSNLLFWKQHWCLAVIWGGDMLRPFLYPMYNNSSGSFIWNGFMSDWSVSTHTPTSPHFGTDAGGGKGTEWIKFWVLFS